MSTSNIVVDFLRPALVVELNEQHDGMLCEFSSKDLLEVSEHLALSLGEASHLEHQQENMGPRYGQSQAVLHQLYILHPVFVPQLRGVDEDELPPCCVYLLSLAKYGR